MKIYSKRWFLNNFFFGKRRVAAKKYSNKTTTNINVWNVSETPPDKNKLLTTKTVNWVIEKAISYCYNTKEVFIKWNQSFFLSRRVKIFNHVSTHKIEYLSFTWHTPFATPGFFSLFFPKNVFGVGWGEHTRFGRGTRWVMIARQPPYCY